MSTPKRKTTLLDWLCLWGVFAVCCVILWHTLWANWYGGHTPAWALAFDRWTDSFLPSWLHF